MAGSASSCDIHEPTISFIPKELVKWDEKTGDPEIILVDKCAKYIINEFHIKTVNKDLMYYYENGVYKSGAEDIIRTFLTNMFLYTYNAFGESLSSKKMQNEIIYKVWTLGRIKLEDFDKDLFIINMKNGLYNWYTGEFKEHTPDYLSIIQIPVSYDPVATCPNIDKMLGVAAKQKDIIKLFEFVAYLLYRGYPIQKFLILFGLPHTGKSVFLNILVAFIGAINKSSVSLQDISKDRSALVEFYGKLANLSGELSKEVIYTDEVKRLTSNTDPIRARDVYKTAINYVNFAKLVFVTNILPPVGEDIAGFAKRVEIARFDHVYTKEEYDKKFLDSLTSPEELSGLFNKAIKLLPDLIKRNEFTNQLTTEEATKMYAERSIPEENFFDICVRENPEEYIGKKELYDYYVRYCNKVKISPKTLNKFGAYIKKNVNWIDKEDMKATKKVLGVVFAIWPNTFFDKAAFNNWLNNKD